MSSSVLTPARLAQPAEPSFLMGCLLGLLLGGALAVLTCVLILRL